MTVKAVNPQPIDEPGLLAFREVLDRTAWELCDLYLERGRISRLAPDTAEKIKETCTAATEAFKLVLRDLAELRGMPPSQK